MTREDRAPNVAARPVPGTGVRASRTLAGPADDGRVRLNKFLADHGIASRRRCDELIADGKVNVDDEPVTQLGTRIDPETQKVEINGVVLQPKDARKRYYLLNKPAGVVCTNEERELRPRAIDLINERRKGRIYTVGRLDEATVGLVILTNDGEFANQIMHPRYGVPKTYLVKIGGRVLDDALQRVREGVYLSEGRTSGARILVKKRTDRSSTLMVTLWEGKNREVRRIFARVGWPILSLRRVRIGHISDRGLKIGSWRPLTRSEIDELLHFHENTPTDEPEPPRSRTRSAGSSGGSPRYRSGRGSDDAGGRGPGPAFRGEAAVAALPTSHADAADETQRADNRPLTTLSMGSPPLPPIPRPGSGAWRRAPKSKARKSASDVLLRGGAEVREHRLKNGLRVLLAERHADPVVAVMTFFEVGSGREDAPVAGVSHFLEHMMFKGSKRYGKGEVDRLTTELGGQNNAYTGYDHTAYWFEFASDRWEAALEIEADRMQHLLLDEGEFEAERAVVLEELSMGLDDPWRALTSQVEQALFPRHAYGRPIIGYADTLADMTVADMRAHYERYYRPENATLVLCGDLRGAPALRSVRAAFGDLPGLAKGAAPERSKRSAPFEPPYAEHRLSMTWDDSGKRLAIAWPTAPVATPHDYALDVANTILTAGRRSRLYRRLVQETELAVSVSSHNDTRVDGGAFWIMVDATPEADPRAVEAVIDAEIARLRDELVPAAELKRAKSIQVASEAHESEAVTDVAESLGEFAVDADWRLALDGCVHQQRVTASALRQSCALLLTDKRRVLGWCLPEGER